MNQFLKTVHARLAITAAAAIAFLVDKGDSGLLRPCPVPSHALVRAFRAQANQPQWKEALHLRRVSKRAGGHASSFRHHCAVFHGTSGKNHGDHELAEARGK